MPRLALLNGLLLLCVATASARAAQEPAVDSGPGPVEAAQAGAEGRVDVRASGGKLGVRAENAALGRLLDEIRTVTGLQLSVSAAAAQDRVSVDLRGVFLEEALRAVLGGHEAFWQYGPGAALRAVWVYRPDEAKGFEPAPREALERTAELTARLHDPDPAVRSRAFQALLQRPGSDSVEAAAAVIGERDDNVRAGMIEAVRSSGLELPPQVWGSLIADPVEQIRILALDALQDSPNLREFAGTALADPSPHVRQRAQEILNEIRANSENAPARP